MPKIPETIGKYLAQLQDMIDGIVEYGAKKLDAIDDSPLEKKKDDAVATEVKEKNDIISSSVNAGVRIGKVFLKGIGRMGRSYYDEYEKLKEEKRDEKK